MFFLTFIFFSIIAQPPSPWKYMCTMLHLLHRILEYKTIPWSYISFFYDIFFLNGQTAQHMSCFGCQTPYEVQNIISKNLYEHENFNVQFLYVYNFIRFLVQGSWRFHGVSVREIKLLQNVYFLKESMLQGWGTSLLQEEIISAFSFVQVYRTAPCFRNLKTS